uniref:Uncharacterized protein n=1 Tax=Macrostomum lignano TaxID=282301 RepID=A0A1I8GYH4_9PLAT
MDACVSSRRLILCQLLGKAW